MGGFPSNEQDLYNRKSVAEIAFTSDVSKALQRTLGPQHEEHSSQSFGVLGLKLVACSCRLVSIWIADSSLLRLSNKHFK
jgi:hypothetical protein